MPLLDHMNNKLSAFKELNQKLEAARKFKTQFWVSNETIISRGLEDLHDIGRRSRIFIPDENAQDMWDYFYEKYVLWEDGSAMMIDICIDPIILVYVMDRHKEQVKEHLIAFGFL